MEFKWQIWSNEHNGWWRHNRNGYTKIRTEAGVYSYGEAVAICTDANAPHETMLPAE